MLLFSGAAGLAGVIGSMLVFAAATTPATTEPAHERWIDSKDGELIFHACRNAPYPHASREKGYKTSTTQYARDPHYTNSTVAIFVPRNFKASDSVNYIVHFHGHKNHISKVMTDYDLAHQVEKSGVNAVLVVPQLAWDAPDSGGGKLELDDRGLRRLLEEVGQFLVAEKKTRSASIGTLVITAHSGGYEAAGGVVHHGGLDREISDVILFDATYGSLAWFANWTSASPEHRLVSFYTDHLAKRNAELMQMFDQRSLGYQRLDDAGVSRKALSHRSNAFIATKLAHDDVPSKRDYFSLLLSTSALPRQ